MQILACIYVQMQKQTSKSCKVCKYPMNINILSKTACELWGKEKGERKGEKGSCQTAHLKKDVEQQ